MGSYHNHPGYCDGSGTVAEYVEAALAAGLTSVGVSCHAPAPFTTDWTMPLARLFDYRDEVRRARARYADQIPVLLGLELDYLAPTLEPDGAAFQRDNVLSVGLDYIVASVHFVGRETSGVPWTIDFTGESFDQQLRDVYGGDVRRLLEDYYDHVVAMARQAPTWGLPVVVGHVDKVKMWNVDGGYFDESASWYADTVERALGAIREAGLVVEINTAGLRRAHGEPYPGPRVLRRCRELGIPVTVSSDAHKPADLVSRFDDAHEFLRAAGHSAVVALSDRGWVERSLP